MNERKIVLGKEIIREASSYLRKRLCEKKLLVGRKRNVTRHGVRRKWEEQRLKGRNKERLRGTCEKIGGEERGGKRRQGK